MSLNITLTNNKQKEELASINWLRNPFGLCNWAEDNVKPTDLKEKDLYYVVNHWNYEKSDQINRALFKKVVYDYWYEIRKLERGYFFFTLQTYIQFVEPNLSALPKVNIHFLNNVNRIKDSYYTDDNRIAVPQEYFNNPIFNLSGSTLEHYKNWFKELVDFADLLQNKDNAFYCSN